MVAIKNLFITKKPNIMNMSVFSTVYLPISPNKPVKIKLCK